MSGAADDWGAAPPPPKSSATKNVESGSGAEAPSLLSRIGGLMVDPPKESGNIGAEEDEWEEESTPVKQQRVNGGQVGSKKEEASRDQPPPSLSATNGQSKPPPSPTQNAQSGPSTLDTAPSSQSISTSAPQSQTTNPADGTDEREGRSRQPSERGDPTTAGPSSSQSPPKLGLRSRHASPEKGPATELLTSSYEVKVTLADQQGDPNSPLYSAKSFEELGLHPSLLKGLYAMKFSKPSKIQERALPLLLASPPQNMIGQSQSGTGKTAAFSLTMLSRIDYSIPNVVQAVCLAPSRELARQIQSVIEQMGQFVPCKTFLGVKEGWKRGQKVEANIVVGTPGTVMDMLQRGSIDPKAIKVIVLDEADTMLDMQGLGDHCNRARRMCPVDAQVVCFSATFPDKVRKFASTFAPRANEIKLAQNELSVDGIKQFYMDCKDEESKYDVLVDLYSLLTIGQSIIFCKQRNTADRIAQRMIDEGHSVASLHGDKGADERDGLIDGFRAGRTKVLITTNVIARGIDIQQVNMVVNYDTPDHMDGSADTETYLHRVGRTGRFGRKGVAILFVSNQRSWAQLRQIEEELQRTIVKVETGDFEAMEETLKREMKK